MFLLMFSAGLQISETFLKYQTGQIFRVIYTFYIALIFNALHIYIDYQPFKLNKTTNTVEYKQINKLIDFLRFE